MPPSKKSVDKATTDRQTKTQLKNHGYLVIVESPSKCKKIEEYLGPQFRCISSKGHFREVGTLKNIDTKHKFKCSYRIIESKADHVAWMRSIIAAYPPENIILASDDDREGEAIAWHICDEFGLAVATTKRVVFHEITKAAICAAVNDVLVSPRTINMALVCAQHARQVLDLIVGFRISPVLWRKVSNSKQNSLSAGRCQTPALRLVYERDLLIREALSAIQTEGCHSPTERVLIKYRVVGYFSIAGCVLPFVLEGRPPITDKTAMLEFIQKSKIFAHTLEVGPERVSSRGAPKPLTTSKLLQAASSQLHLSPKKTMDLAQILYQSGLITYMRTTSQRYSAVFLGAAREYIIKKYDCVGANPEKWFADFADLDNAGSADPHEAIRPTNLAMVSFDNENAALVRLYQLIWRTTVESCLAAAKYNVADIRASSPSPEHRYFYTWETPVFQGWNIVAQEPKSESKKYSEKRDAAQIPDLFVFRSINGPVPLNVIEAKCVELDAPPSHYTESSLVKALEDLGIGRPSTFSSLVETIQDRGYVLKSDVEGREVECTEYIFKKESHTLETATVKKRFGEEKNKLVIQPIGIIVLEFLIAHFGALFAYEYTEQMERMLDLVAACVGDVAKAETMSAEMCRQCYDQISALLQSSSVNKSDATQGENVEVDDCVDADSSSSPAPEEEQRVTFPVKDAPDKRIIFHPYGVSVRVDAKDSAGAPTTTYINVRPDLKFDVETARKGLYTFADLTESGLGEYDGHPLQIKRGKYGEYLQWSTNTLSLKDFSEFINGAIDSENNDPLRKSKSRSAKKGANASAYCRENLVKFIESKLGPLEKRDAGSNDEDKFKTSESSPAPKNKMILLELSENVSVRNGKYGPYIYYMPLNKKNAKPEFHSLKGFKGNVESREDVLKWIDAKIPSIPH